MHSHGASCNFWQLPYITSTISTVMQCKMFFVVYTLQ
jgi:hypothetical protein